jgi:hypothetical protein
MPTADPMCDVIARLERYEKRVSGISRRDREELVSALAYRSYHLPGNSYCDDWLQYFQNNHPVISLFCHHRLHPIGFKIRLLQLFGSIVFGLTVTNIMWLWFHFNNIDEEDPAITISLGGADDTADTTTDNVQAHSTSSFEITQGMILLWTVGGGLHAIYDNTIWYVSACVCCLSSKRFDKIQCCGTYCILFVVMLLTGIATLAILLRSSAETAEENHEEYVGIQIQDASAYQFLITYATELVLSLFIYYPIVGTILFSGLLGCGKVPILGGRPYEVLVEQRKNQTPDGSDSSV